MVAAAHHVILIPRPADTGVRIILSTVLLVLGALLLGVAVFFLTLKIAGGKSEKK